MVGIIFKLGGIHALFGMPTSEFTDQYIEAGLINSKMIEETLDSLHEAESHVEKIGVIEKMLIQNLSFNNHSTHMQMTRLCREYCDNELSMSELMERIGYTPKYAIALFKEYAGTSPKKYYRLDRFRKLLETINRGKKLKWTEIGTQFGYYDQAHFIHDFRKFSGLTPREYLYKEKLNENLCSTD